MSKTRNSSYLAFLKASKLINHKRNNDALKLKVSNKNIVKNVTLLGGTLYTSNLNQNNERNIENAPRN